MTKHTSILIKANAWVLSSDKKQINFPVHAMSEIIYANGNLAIQDFLARRLTLKIRTTVTPVSMVNGAQWKQSELKNYPLYGPVHRNPFHAVTQNACES